MVRQRVNFKLRETATPDKATARLSRIPGVTKIERLFPDETDPELAALYTTEAYPSSIDAALKQIAADPDVEFAELPTRRKLI